MSVGLLKTERSTAGILRFKVPWAPRQGVKFAFWEPDFSCVCVVFRSAKVQAKAAAKATTRDCSVAAGSRVPDTNTIHVVDVIPAGKNR
jgi:hypothetical protein